MNTSEEKEIAEHMRDIRDIERECRAAPVITLANKCEYCEAAPLPYWSKGNLFSTVFIGCKPCKTRGPSRMEEEKAIQNWNAGERVIIKGQYVEP